MEGSDETNAMHSIASSFTNCSAVATKQANHRLNVHSQMSLNSSVEGNKRPGIPPCHPHFPPTSPHSQLAMAKLASEQVVSQSYTMGPTHSRSLSQSSFFSFDNLPPLSTSPFVRESPSTSFAAYVSIEDRAYNTAQQVHPVQAPPFAAAGPMIDTSEDLLPRRGHRRSCSDIPLGFDTSFQPSSRSMPPEGPVFSDRFAGQKAHDVDGQKPVQPVISEFGFGSSTAGVEDVKKTDSEAVGDLFSAYMNLDSIDSLNSSSVEDKDMDSRASGTRTNDSSENEVESGIKGTCNGSGTGRDRRDRGGKRSATGDIAPTSRHFRSLSMDSFIGTLNFKDESSRLPPSPGVRSGQQSPSDLSGGNSYKFSMEFGNDKFSAAELKKITTNEKLAEIAMADPKRAKRILANRQSAARSKERKLRYISELEHKVQILQTEATTLSAQLTLLQRDSAGLTNENNELRFRLQAMEQQAQLRDALNEALTAEVQRLKLATCEIRGESPHQLMLKDDYQRLQMQNKSSQFNMSQVQCQERNQNQNQSQESPAS